MSRAPRAALVDFGDQNTKIYQSRRQLRAILDSKPDHGLPPFLLVRYGDGRTLDLWKDEPSQGCPWDNAVNIDWVRS